MAKKQVKTVGKMRSKSVDKQGGIRGWMEYSKNLWGQEAWRFIVGVVLMVCALFLLVAFTSHFFTGWEEQSSIEAGMSNGAKNYGGTLGARAAEYFMDRGFGISAYFIPVFTIVLGIKLIKVYRIRLWKWFLNCAFLMIWISVTMALLQSTVLPCPDSLTFNWGGLHGQGAVSYLEGKIGIVSAFAVVIATLIFYLTYLSRETIVIVRSMFAPHHILKNELERFSKREKTSDVADSRKNQRENLDIASNDEEDEGAGRDDGYTVSLNLSHNVEDEKQPELILENTESEEDKKIDDSPIADNNNITAKQQPESSEIFKPYDPRLDLENYHFPTVDLLKKYADSSPQVDMAEQNANKDKIITVLKNFGVEIKSIKATIGPTITLYEITPAPGVRISKIRNLEDDIALSLSAMGIRIIAPIPGKGTIGIEVPSSSPKIVSMESIINTRKFKETTFELPIALGKTITNEVFMVDLAKLPHLLVAGATGQGKSVGLNAIITSLLYKKHPSELKFVMVDPKKVEFSVYAPIENHFLAKIPDEGDAIITDVTKVVQTLKSLCQLMDTRYDLLKKARVRNIKEYNAKFKERVLNPENGHEFMPYIVVVIDEFGDLMLTAGKEIEYPITRLAQLARAVGIHMVFATQRPTTNIITGTIKANFPARMAFKVMSKIDSQTILDRTGANQLVGKGDMLFLAVNDPVRVQCAFVDTPEVERISNFIATQQGYLSPYILPEVIDADGDSGSNAQFDMSSVDPMFEEAARLIVAHQQGSTSLIQRKFSIGYNRAGRLMDQLEKAGIVGPTKGAKPRDVLCVDDQDLEMKLNNFR